MSTDIVIRPATGLAPGPGFDIVPAIVADERAAYRFLEFFTANIRNRNTRKAYYRNAIQFFEWTDARRTNSSTRK